jgi:hypothetical protein
MPIRHVVRAASATPAGQAEASEFEFAAATVWTIQHNFDTTWPIITVRLHDADTDRDEIVTMFNVELDATDRANVAIIRWPIATAGTARVIKI